jgi:hypothetical protein
MNKKFVILKRRFKRVTSEKIAMSKHNYTVERQTYPMYAVIWYREKSSTLTRIFNNTLYAREPIKRKTVVDQK